MLILLSSLIIALGFQISSSGYFEIQYPGESGFFAGKPMVYTVTANSNDPKGTEQEGIFIFGSGKIYFSGIEYYDCTFGSDFSSPSSHFYMRPDDSIQSLLLRSIKFGNTNMDINPAVSTLKYPLVAGKKWSEKTKLIAENVSIPGVGVLPKALNIENVKAETSVSAQVVSVPAGTFNTLLVESTYTGTLIGIPMTLIQRTWVNEDNVAIKRNFEFTKPTKLMLYALELSKPNPNPFDLNWDSVVNILDLISVAKFVGKPLQRVMIPNPDVDNSGSMDIGDLKTLISHFGKTKKYY